MLSPIQLSFRIQRSYFEKNFRLLLNFPLSYHGVEPSVFPGHLPQIQRTAVHFYLSSSLTLRT